MVADQSSVTLSVLVVDSPAVGAASAISETGYEVGAVLGTAVLGGLLTAFYQRHLDLPAALDAGSSAAAHETLGGAVEVAEGAGALGPAVQEAAVIGLPHPKWQERPLLIVVKRPGSDPTRAELLDFMAARIARWQVPDDVVFVDDLPFNLKPARALGMATVRHVDAAQTIAELEGLLGVELA